jgi:RNA recognition motif-containing protein
MYRFNACALKNSPLQGRRNSMNIYVGNIPRETTESDVRDAFEQFGEVSAVNLIKDKFTNTLKGFGFVDMPKQTEAESAIKGLDGQMFSGRPLTVNPAKPKTESHNNNGGRKFRTGY